MRYKIEENKSLIYDSETDTDICMYFDTKTRDNLLEILNIGHNESIHMELPLTPENTILFKETRSDMPSRIEGESKPSIHKEYYGYKYSPENPPYIYRTFGIVINDFENGIYTLFNNERTQDSMSGSNFTPYNAKPLKTIGDLNRVWKGITGKNLTLK